MTYLDRLFNRDSYKLDHVWVIFDQSQPAIDADVRDNAIEVSRRDVKEPELGVRRPLRNLLLLLRGRCSRCLLLLLLLVSVLPIAASGDWCSGCGGRWLRCPKGLLIQLLGLLDQRGTRSRGGHARKSRHRHGIHRPCTEASWLWYEGRWSLGRH